MQDIECALNLAGNHVKSQATHDRLLEAITEDTLVGLRNRYIDAITRPFLAENDKPMEKQGELVS